MVGVVVHGGSVGSDGGGGVGGDGAGFLSFSFCC